MDQVKNPVLNKNRCTFEVIKRYIMDKIYQTILSMMFPKELLEYFELDS
jgi:hypothetical protein